MSVNEFQHSIGEKWAQNFFSKKNGDDYIVEARSHFSPKHRKDEQVAYTPGQVKGMLTKLKGLTAKNKFIIIVRTFRNEDETFNLPFCYFVVVPQIILERYSESNMYFTKNGKRGKETWETTTNGLVKYYPISQEYLVNNKKVQPLKMPLTVEKNETNPRNPPWSREELILALELYFRHHPNSINKNNPEVLKLSNILNILTTKNDKSDIDRFRNPNGVYMKMCNFLRFDPSYKGKGLSGGGKLEEEIWNEFANDKKNLIKVSELIKLGIEVQSVVVELEKNAPKPTLQRFNHQRSLHGERELENSLYDMSDKQFEEYINGLDSNASIQVKNGLVKVRKYNKKIIDDLKDRCNNSCQICGFSGIDAYGASVVEGHHIEKFSLFQNNKPENILIVCPNHHRLIHKADGRFNRQRLEIAYTNGTIETLSIKSHFSQVKETGT